MPWVERIIAPVFVLCLHTLLVLDVVSHQKDILPSSGLRAVPAWLSAALAVSAYLRTVISDPGFLRVPPLKAARPGPFIPVGLLAILGGGLAVLWRGGGAGSAVGTAGRDTHEVTDARELRPIGRAQLEAAGSEADSDPGEETIELADLEGGGGHGTNGTISGGSTEGGTADSLGSIPGTPRMGRKRREPASSRNDETTQQNDTRRVVMQSGHRLRFCKSCSMHQPLRTKHCRDCGHCVRTHDHHCPWVGTCVGEGNRVYFFWFLVAQCVELMAFMAEGCLALLKKNGLDPLAWVNQAPALCLGLFVIALLLIMVSCLLCFHTYLAVSNTTTWENISWHNISYLRSLPPEDGSPFSTTLSANLAVYCCPYWFPGFGCCSDTPPLKRTEDDWAIWELGDQTHPLEVDCHVCGCDCKCNLCGCFEAF